MNELAPISSEDIDDTIFTLEISEAFGIKVPFEKDPYWEHLLLPEIVVESSHEDIDNALAKLGRHYPDLYLKEEVLADALLGLPETMLADIFRGYLQRNFPLLDVSCYGVAYEYYHG